MGPMPGEAVSEAAVSEMGRVGVPGEPTWACRACRAAGRHPAPGVPGVCSRRAGRHLVSGVPGVTPCKIVTRGA